MYSAKKQTAVLIFANSSREDGLRKGIPNSRLLFDALNEDILNKVKKTNLPYFIFDEHLQIGNDFGTRFTAAIQSIFSKGFESIITVGNDTPNLTSELIYKAYENLCEGKTVVGPSTDGGVYLLGLHKKRFDPIFFRKLPWQKRNLFVELAKYFLLLGGMLHQLPRLHDLDTFSDLKIIQRLGKSIAAPLLSALTKLLKRTKIRTGVANNRQNTTYLNTHFNKGSPDQLRFS